MALRPRYVEIRAYQVGFGDCSLLSFVYGERDRRHVLIDFGTTALGRGGKGPKPSEHLPAVARDIAKVCQGRLTAVVATHRHADHISGFATDARSGQSGLIIRRLEPQLVLQPWTEDPAAATDARTATTGTNRSRRSVTAGLAAMQEIAQAVYDLAQRRPAWMGPALQKELSFLGEDNIANKSAVQNLIAMGAAAGAKPVFAHHGSPSGLEPLLDGVRVRVLGPPNLEQTESIRKMRARDPDEFWHLLAGSRALHARPVIGAAPGSGGGMVPAEARWFRNHLDRLRGEQLLQIVRTLDAQMNNTSLILLFEVNGRMLLFPGDAQLENWSYALQEAPDAAATRRLLAGVRVYKVGHHGSLNATPKTLLWQGFRRRGAGKRARLMTLLSTMPGKHGTTQNRTEVPRRPLLEALRAETRLWSTDTLGFGTRAPLCHVIRVPLR